MVTSKHFQINKANGEDLTSIGLNINIPRNVWIGLGTALTVPTVLILLLIILKQKL